VALRTLHQARLPNHRRNEVIDLAFQPTDWSADADYRSSYLSG
jgi:hypothetical protein